MRLIDADEAKSKAIICTNAVIFGDESEEMITFARTVLDLLLMALDDAPTIVAEPVRHGRWINAYDTHGGSYYKCSRCACYIEKIFFANDYEVNYCPNCGAKMDGGEGNE